MNQQMKWLGHVGRMNDEQLPKSLMFRELRRIWPCHWARKRWKDHVCQDLTFVGAKDSWYQAGQDSKEWFDLCQEGVAATQEEHMQQTCHHKGSGTFVNVEETSDKKATLPDINDFARVYQSEICQLPRTTIEGCCYHSDPYYGRLQSVRVCMCAHACVYVCVCECVCIWEL